MSTVNGIRSGGKQELSLHACSLTVPAIVTGPGLASAGTVIGTTATTLPTYTFSVAPSWGKLTSWPGG